MYHVTKSALLHLACKVLQSKENQRFKMKRTFIFAPHIGHLRNRLESNKIKVVVKIFFGGLFLIKDFISEWCILNKI